MTLARQPKTAFAATVPGPPTSSRSQNSARPPPKTRHLPGERRHKSVKSLFSQLIPVFHRVLIARFSFAANATVAFSLSAHIPSEVVAAHGPSSGLSVTHPARELEPPRIRVDRRRTRRAPSKIHGWSRTKHRPVLPMFDDGYISILDRIRWAPWERPHSKPG